MAKKNKQQAPASTDARTPEMKAAWEAFDRGDFRAARRAAKSVLAASGSEDAKADARDLIQRTNLEKGTLLALVTLAVVIAGIIVVLATRG